MHTLLVGVPELVRLHLTEPEHCILALVAVVVGLLPVVGAPAAAGAVLRRRVLLEARGHDVVQLLVLPAMGHHLVGVRAGVVALEAVEVAAALLGLARECYDWKVMRESQLVIASGGNNEMLKTIVEKDVSLAR